MLFDDPFEHERWKKVLGEAAWALKRAKRYERAFKDGSSAETIHLARVQFQESCGGPLNARSRGGYASDVEWQDFKKQYVNFANIVDEIILCINAVFRAMNTGSESLDWLARAEKAIGLLASELSNDASQYEERFYISVVREDNRCYIELKHNRYRVEEVQATYFERLMSATLNSTGFSGNDAKKDPSGYFTSHPERILKELKALLPEGVIENTRSGSRIAPNYLEENGLSIKG